MNILLVTHIFPPAVDGGSRIIAKMGEYLDKLGHQITVLTTDCCSTDDFVNPASNTLPHQRSNVLPYQRSNTLIFSLPVYKRLRRPLKLFNLLIPRASYFHQLLSVFQKGPILKFIPFIKFLIFITKNPPDLIIAGPLPTTIILYARLLRFLTNALTLQRSKLLLNASFHPTDQDFLRLPLIRTLHSADYIWTLSDFETDYFINKLHINSDKIINLGIGLDSDFLAKAPKRSSSNVLPHQRSNVLLYVGSFSSHKNIDLLIDAFTFLLNIQRSNAPTISLVLAGQKTLYWPTLKNKIDNLPSKVKKRIKIIFSFADELRSEIYDQATILIQPSSQESFGLTLVEAWARHRSVITSDIPVFKEIITKSNGGLIFRHNDPHDLADKISALLKNQKLQQHLASNGFAYTKSHYLWDKIALSLCQKLKL